MSFPFTGSSGLFTRLGALYAQVVDTNLFQNSILTDAQAIIAQYPSNNDAAMINGISSAAVSAQSAAGSFTSNIQTYATNTVNTMVYNYNPLYSNSNLTASLQYLISLMEAESVTVKQVTVGSTVSAGANQGNGVCVATCYLANGTISQNIYPENIQVSCQTDSTTSSSLAGNEQFVASGTVASQNALSQSFPGGSGAQIYLSAINAQVSNSEGNLLTNSDFETWTANVPNNWSVLVGTAGTQILQGTSEFFTGASSLEFVGDGTTLTSIAQSFNSSAGTVGKLASGTQYACNCWVYVPTVPGSGVLEISLVNGSNVVVQDGAGNNNSFTVALTGLTAATWTPVSGFFRLPYILPSTLKLRVSLSTALSASHSVYVDTLALGLAQSLYAGGPSLAIFSGSENFYSNLEANPYLPDYFVVDATNNYAGVSNYATFSACFERFFNMTSLGLQLPYSASPSISDSLITPTL